MSKTVVLGVLAFGGLLLIAVMLPGTPEETPEVVHEEVQTPTLPSDLPPAIPIYPGSTVRASSDTAQDGERHITVSLSAEATIAEVNTWYRGALKQNGWSIKSDRNIGGYTIIQGENDTLYTSMQAANGSATGEVVISQQIKVRQ